MNRQRVHGLAIQALASTAGKAYDPSAETTPELPNFAREQAGWIPNYDRESFLFDLSGQLVEATTGSRPMPTTDGEWAVAVVRSYLARAAARAAARP